MAISTPSSCPRYTITCILLLFLHAKSQEPPSFYVPKFSTGISHQTNFCPLHEAVEDGRIERKHALRGWNISVGFIDYQLNAETGGIDPANPDIAIEIMDEIASMAGFSYRDSYGVIDTPEDDETWTEILYWGVGVYDIMGEWFIESVYRLAEGNVLYPEGWYDGNLILVRRKTEEDSSLVLELFAWTTPFTPTLWCLIAMTTVISGLVYYILDYFDSRICGKPLDVTLEQSLFYAAFSFNGHYVHEPKSRGARILVYSLAFFFLIVAAAYTANLASFLVLRNRPKVVINSVPDAVRHGLTFCVQKNGGQEEHLRTYNIPQSMIVRNEESKGVYLDLLEGKCDILLSTRGEYETYRKSAELNPYCDLEFVGRIIKFESAGFAVGDSERHCTSLLRDILHLYLLEMKDNPTFDLIWDQYREKAATVTCDLKDGREDEGSGSESSMGIENLSGIFVLHLTALSVASLATLARFLLQPNERKRRMICDFFSFSLLSGQMGNDKECRSDDEKSRVEKETEAKYNDKRLKQKQSQDSLTNSNCSTFENHTRRINSSSSEPPAFLVNLVQETLYESKQKHREAMESIKDQVEEKNQQHKEEIESMKGTLDERNQQCREETQRIRLQHQNEMEECQKRHQQEMEKFWLLLAAQQLGSNRQIRQSE